MIAGLSDEKAFEWQRGGIRGSEVPLDQRLGSNESPMIYLVRHGETELNVARRHQGNIDSPLTELGRRQATGAARALRAMVSTTDTVIYSSPLGRALRTAQIIAEGIPVAAPIIVDTDLREIAMGSAEGLTCPISTARRERPSLLPRRRVAERASLHESRDRT